MSNENWKIRWKQQKSDNKCPTMISFQKIVIWSIYHDLFVLINLLNGWTRRKISISLFLSWFMISYCNIMMSFTLEWLWIHGIIHKMKTETTNFVTFVVKILKLFFVTHFIIRHTTLTHSNKTNIYFTLYFLVD